MLKDRRLHQKLCFFYIFVKGTLSKYLTSYLQLHKNPIYQTRSTAKNIIKQTASRTVNFNNIFSHAALKIGITDLALSRPQIIKFLEFMTSVFHILCLVYFSGNLCRSKTCWYVTDHVTTRNKNDLVRRLLSVFVTVFDPKVTESLNKVGFLRLAKHVMGFEPVTLGLNANAFTHKITLSSKLN